MINYKDSDYALNKHSEGIVYKFSDGRKQTIWLEDYLAANTDNTVEGFAKLKAWSDNQYHEQVIVDHRTGRLDVTINDWEETEQLSTAPIDVELIEKTDAEKAMTASKQLLDSGDLTEVQRRRFILHFYQGMSTRKIGQMEGVSHKNVLKSIHLARKKLKFFFEK